MIRRLLSALRREQPQDAFGGDDLYEDEEEPRNMGRKIALGISGLLFASLLGLGVFVYIAGKDAPPPAPVAMMSLDDLQIEEEPADAAATPGAPGATAPTVPDATAATDRSNERRPWLNAQPGTAAPTPAAPGAKTAATPPAAAPAPTPASAPAPTTVAKAPGMITPPAPAMPMPPVTKVTPPGPVATAPVPPPPGAKGAAQTPGPQTPGAQTPATPPPASLDALMPKDEPAPEAAQGTEVADAAPVNVAPGAPERFAAKGELSSVGRPMLADPPLPPTDKTYLGAAPPRFGNLAVMKANAAPLAADKAGKATKIAIIVQGLGLNADATTAAMDKLPKNVTLSFSPYARDIRKWLTKAKNAEREVLVEVPMESKLFPAEDPGPLGLMTELETKENMERLQAILRTFPGVIGIDDIMGSKFRESGAPMAEVFSTLKENKLIYVQGRPGVRSISEPGVPNAVADVVLDDRPFRAAIDARLDYTERLAKFQGSAVAVMSPRPVSFERLALWLQQLDKRGIQLAPISQVLAQSGPPA